MNPSAIGLFVAYIFLVNYTVFDVGALPCLNCKKNKTKTEKKCSEEEKIICVWGEGRDACQHRICLKGPGEKCGDGIGICGDGMVCTGKEKRCRGCYIATLTCFPPSYDD